MFEFEAVYFQMLGTVSLNATGWTEAYPWGTDRNSTNRIWGCYLPLVDNVYRYGLFGYIQATSNEVFTKKENNTLSWYSVRDATGQFNVETYTYYYLYF